MSHVNLDTVVKQQEKIGKLIVACGELKKKCDRLEKANKDLVKYIEGDIQYHDSLGINDICSSGECVEAGQHVLKKNKEIIEGESV